ncbi:MAG TPA: YihY/virulence factor BrkB family protein [Candidatus Obscuribacterales bacterium]
MSEPSGSNKLTVKEVLSRTWRNVNEHEILTRASAIAFSSMMAAVPFLALVLTALVYLLPDLSGSGANGIGNLTPDELVTAIRAVFPPEVADVIAEQIRRMQTQPPVGLLSITLLMMLWMASGVFVDIIDALNRIYGVKEKRPYWRVRLTAIVLTLMQLVILFLCATAIIAWPLIVSFLGLTGEEELNATLLKWVVVFIAILGSFALTFRLGPYAAKKERWVTPGSFFGTVVFLASTVLFRIYVQNFAQYDRFYGSLGGVMALLFWLWISSLVLLVAAEMNRVVEYAVIRKRECAKRPDNGALESGNGKAAKNRPAREEPLLSANGQEQTGNRSGLADATAVDDPGAADMPGCGNVRDTGAARGPNGERASNADEAQGPSGNSNAADAQDTGTG